MQNLTLERHLNELMLILNSTECIEDFLDGYGIEQQDLVVTLGVFLKKQKMDYDTIMQTALPAMITGFLVGLKYGLVEVDLTHTTS